MIGLSIFFSVIVFSLAFYLGTLIVKLKSAKSSAHFIDEEQLNLRREGILESLEVLSKVIIQEQCELTEGCIRVKKLIDILDDYKEDEFLIIFSTMYEQINQFAIFDEYQKLSLKERVRQDSERRLVEERFSSEIKTACQYLTKKIQLEKNN